MYMLLQIIVSDSPQIGMYTTSVPIFFSLKRTYEHRHDMGYGPAHQQGRAVRRPWGLRVMDSGTQKVYGQPPSMLTSVP